MPTATIAAASKLCMFLSLELSIWLNCHRTPLRIVKLGSGSRFGGSSGAFFLSGRSTDPNLRNPRNPTNALRFSRPPNHLGAVLSKAPVPPRRGFLFVCYTPPAGIRTRICDGSGMLTVHEQFHHRARCPIVGPCADVSFKVPVLYSSPLSMCLAPLGCTSFQGFL